MRKHHKTFTKSEMRQGCLSSPVFRIVLEVLANTLWLEKEMRSVNTGKEEINEVISICRYNSLAKIEK